MWTSFDDVSDRWIGGAMPADEQQVTTLIEDVEDMIAAAFPDIQTRIDDETLPLVRVQKVVARVVTRFLRNPTGQRQVTQGAGPFQQSVTYGGDEPGALYLTDADKAELAAPRSLRGKAFSVDLTPAEGYYPPVPDYLLWEPIR